MIYADLNNLQNKCGDWSIRGVGHLLHLESEINGLRKETQFYWVKYKLLMTLLFTV